MTDNALLSVISALIVAIPSSLLALGSLLKSVEAGRTARSSLEAVKEVHVLINSRMDELLRSRRQEGFDEGVTQGKSDSAARTTTSESASTNELLRELLTIVKTQKQN